MRKLTLEELKKAQAAANRRTLPVTVLLENVRSLWNVGAFFRTADGVGIERILLTGFTAHPPRKEIAKVALGAEDVVPWEHFPDPLAAAREVKSRGIHLIAIEQVAGGEDLYNASVPFPCCLVFGHEVNGISDALLEVCDAAVDVPMHGTKESLNVAVCGGVVLFELRRRFDAQGGIQP
jgi:tRNA G18 (ribose-2'-O)-methylase SpoU